MSRLIDTDPQVQPEHEPEGYEFIYYTFDELPELEVSNIESILNSVTDTETKMYLVVIYRNFLWVIIFCTGCNKKMHFVRIF